MGLVTFPLAATFVAQFYDNVLPIFYFLLNSVEKIRISNSTAHFSLIPHGAVQHDISTQSKMAVIYLAPPCYISPLALVIQASSFPTSNDAIKE